jgi:hypothetical protein
MQPVDDFSITLILNKLIGDQSLATLKNGTDCQGFVTIFQLLSTRLSTAAVDNTGPFIIVMPENLKKGTKPPRFLVVFWLQRE